MSVEHSRDVEITLTHGSVSDVLNRAKMTDVYGKLLAELTASHKVPSLDVNVQLASQDEFTPTKLIGNVVMDTGLPDQED